MSNKRHKPDEIVTKLRQLEVLRGQGMPMADAVRQICPLAHDSLEEWRVDYNFKRSHRSLDGLTRTNLHSGPNRTDHSVNWANL